MHQTKYRIRLSTLLLACYIGFPHVIRAFEMEVYRNESMPWCGTVNNEHSGITIDILKALTKFGGPKFKFSTLPWARAQRMVLNNSKAGIIPLTRTKAREKQYTWLINLVENKGRMTYAKSPTNKVILPNPLSYNNIKSRRIGIIRSSAFIPTLKQDGFKNIFETHDAEALVKMLAEGRIDVMVESSMVDTYMWKKNGYATGTLLAGPNVGGVKHIYLGAAPDFPSDKKEIIRTAFNKLRQSGELERILQKWQ